MNIRIAIHNRSTLLSSRSRHYAAANSYQKYPVPSERYSPRSTHFLVNNMSSRKVFVTTRTNRIYCSTFSRSATNNTSRN